MKCSERCVNCSERCVKCSERCVNCSERCVKCSERCVKCSKRCVKCSERCVKCSERCVKCSERCAKCSDGIAISAQIWRGGGEGAWMMTITTLLYPPQTLFVGGILFSRCPCVRPSVCPSVRASVRPSVTLCFLNNLESHCWIFIKPCKHVHICKTNTLDKKVRARGQFY